MPTDSEEGLGVVITLTDIYSTQREQSLALAQIQGSLALAAQQVLLAANTSADHEGRIRKVEAKVYALPGGAAIIAAAGLLWSVFGK